MGRLFTGNYEKVLVLWPRKNIATDAELTEALNGFRQTSAEGILFVLSSSCSITPPTGEGGVLHQLVGAAQ